MTPEEEAMQAEIMAEMKAISEKSSNSRFDQYEKKVVSNSVQGAAGTENSDPNGDGGAAFLQGNPEEPSMNQYWYSQPTISALTSECSRLIAEGGADFKVAFLSTPSIYFALSEAERKQCFVFDYDKKWESDRGFVFYDFNDQETLPKELHNTFDLVVIDPPFITREVWEKYTASSKLLLCVDPTENSPKGMVIGTTVAENKDFMGELLGCKPQAFRPSIPNLVYQYNSYANFEGAKFLGKPNPEID
ncbi:hypothetical protein TeGR_g11088 [Tetraparma gracilis]|uniref:Uncharacterized protein n=1 Tax=Tetraparma gracilis TaxID=2962635 RepID=A0ABQ6N2F5_9STRA|nr:hypothetical protein TeGR_g11088 [Tetraparma gracilis]